MSSSAVRNVTQTAKLAGRRVVSRVLSSVLRSVSITPDVAANPRELARVLTLLQENVYGEMQPATSLPFCGGVWLKGVAFGASTLTIAHGLGRPYQGWFVTRALTAAAQLKEVPLSLGVSPKVYIALQAVNPCTADLYLF
jgi:hypothetical protein